MLPRLVCQLIRFSWLNCETKKRSNKPGLLQPGYAPGDLGFDPLGLAPSDPAEFAEMQTKESQSGRLAMIAAAGFLAQEAVNGKGILETLGF